MGLGEGTVSAGLGGGENRGMGEKGLLLWACCEAGCSQLHSRNTRGIIRYFILRGKRGIVIRSAPLGLHGPLTPLLGVRYDVCKSARHCLNSAERSKPLFRDHLSAKRLNQSD